MDLNRNGDALRFMDEIYRTSAGGFFSQLESSFEDRTTCRAKPVKNLSGEFVCSDAQA